MRKAHVTRAAILLVLGLLAAACGNEENPAVGRSPSTTKTLASTFVFGAPPDCATNKFCKLGLKSVYGIEFKQVRSLDFGGPLTIGALKSGAIQVAELFSTLFYEPSFVILADDKHLEPADNIAPIVRTEVATDDVKKLLNAVSAKLTTDGMRALNKQVDIDHKDAAAVAKTFLQQNGLLESKSNTGSGKSLTVGVSSPFAETKIVAEMYAQVLANAGYTVKRQLGLASRKVSDAALFSGKIDLKPEYIASEALALDPKAEATGDSAHNADILRPLLEAKKVTLLDSSAAIDTNVFVVTKATADQYDLSKVSDLAKPAP
jgi:osmoprotectant transport system substrate-binding protein